VVTEIKSQANISQHLDNPDPLNHGYLVHGDYVVKSNELIITRFYSIHVEARSPIRAIRKVSDMLRNRYTDENILDFSIYADRDYSDFPTLILKGIKP
jgi:hypothetical protein